MSKPAEAVPPLGDGSYDFNAIHEAAVKGADMGKAVEAARDKSKDPKKPEASAKPGPDASPTPSPAKGAKSDDAAK